MLATQREVFDGQEKMRELIKRDALSVVTLTPIYAHEKISIHVDHLKIIHNYGKMLGTSIEYKFATHTHIAYVKESPQEIISQKIEIIKKYKNILITYKNK